MAEHPAEVAEITATAQALMLNLGNITDVRMDSMRIATQTAKRMHIPILLDAVGVSCSKLRREYVSGLLPDVMPAVIKGNYSEINALYCDSYRSSGVDADHSLETTAVGAAAAALARKYETVILASGQVDIITDGVKMVRIRNGTKQLSSVTGTGCMLGALCAAYLSSAPAMEAAIAACAVLGICGQLAETEKGSGTFMVNLMDALSTITDEEISSYLEIEEV